MIMNCIIVGLDDSPAAGAALRWAAGYAESTGTDLRAVHVLDWPIGLIATAGKTGTRLSVPKQEVAEAYWRGMHRVFGDTRCPDGALLQFAQGDVGDVLVRLSAHANLLVVGTREPVRGRPYLAGSISHYCISQASCPVVTVPELLSDALPKPSRHGNRQHGNQQHDSPVAVGG